MRLSTAEDRDEERAVAVIHAALAAGATLLDTADAYARDDSETGHNERLVARALQSWKGERVRVATKGGMRRPDGQWVPDGRARSLRSACEASVQVLGLIDVYQLHVPDPRTPLSTSVRALERLYSEGLVRGIGLCNVNVDQIEEASGIVPIAAVQVALSYRDDGALRSGVVRHCLGRGIEVLAHSPLGGWRNDRRHPLLIELAHARGTTPELIALAWLLTLGVTPLVGATRVETARAIGEALRIELDDNERARLDEAFPAGRLAHKLVSVPAHHDGEVVLVAGIAGAGKSRLAEAWAARGYRRLNRDELGGKLAGLLPLLERGLEAGERRWVLDNTYVTRKQRQPVIEAAQRLGAAVRCVWMDTPLAEAQVNATRRLIQRYGTLPTPQELRVLQKKDPHAFDARALFRIHRSVEPPREEEGFTSIEHVTFERVHEEAHAERAVFVQLEGVLRESRRGDRSPLHVEDLVVHEERAARLATWARDHLLFALSWQPMIAEGVASEEQVRACFEETRRRLTLEIELMLCPHAGGPPQCWCRPPLPGLVVERLERHRLDPAGCVMIGSSSADRTLARNVGMRFFEAAAFFTDAP
jgi:aryl-alcohol dehydrogenase-like predicted oxidoreductase/histidinol phosphatase-like enzyme/predicted kinase